MMTSDKIVSMQRPALRSILNAITHFRDLSPTMSVGVVQMFLAVALNEGLNQTELAEIVDMRKSSASRYLLDLSDKTRSGGAGYGLVNRETDPLELRKNVYSLTPKGRNIVQQLTSPSERKV